jgi:hypothetical protein
MKIKLPKNCVTYYIEDRDQRASRRRAVLKAGNVKPKPLLPYNAYKHLMAKLRDDELPNMGCTYIARCQGARGVWFVNRNDLIEWISRPEFERQFGKPEKIVPYRPYKPATNGVQAKLPLEKKTDREIIIDLMREQNRLLAEIVSLWR